MDNVPKDGRLQSPTFKPSEFKRNSNFSQDKFFSKINSFWSRGNSFNARSKFIRLEIYSLFGRISISRGTSDNTDKEKVFVKRANNVSARNSHQSLSKCMLYAQYRKRRNFLLNLERKSCESFHFCPAEVNCELFVWMGVSSKFAHFILHFGNFLLVDVALQPQTIFVLK